MFKIADRRFVALFTAGLLCMLALSACDLQPAIIDAPTPVPTATLIPLQVPPESKGQPTAAPTGDSSKAKPEPTLGPGQFTFANGVPFPVPSTVADSIDATDMQTAWGANVPIRKISSRLDNDMVFLLRGIDENGRFLAGEVAPIDQTSFETSTLALMDLSNNAITLVPNATIQNNRSSYLWSGIAVDDDWIVWQQTDGQKVDLQIYNKASGNMSHLEIAHLNEPDVPGMLATEPEVTSTSVDHGMFVWAEKDTSAAEQGKVATVIKSYDFTTGQTTVIGQHGVSPSISWPYAAWLEPNLSTLTEGEVCSDIAVKNLQTGTTNTLQGYCDLREVAMHDDWVASSTDPSTFLQNAANTRRQIIRGDSGPQIQRVTLNERLVAWAGAGRPSVWDRNLQKIVWLNGFDETNGITAYPDGCLVNGKMLAWQSSAHAPDPAGSSSSSSPDDLSIYVLDTTQLSP